MIIPKRSLWFPSVIMLTVILSGHFFFYCPRRYSHFLRNIVNHPKPLFHKLRNIVNHPKPLFHKSVNLEHIEKGKQKTGEERFEFFLAWLYSYIISLAPLLILIRVIEQIEFKDVLEQFTFLMALIFSVLFTNFCFAFFRELKERKWWHWFIPFFSVFCLIYTVRDPIIPKLVMQKFHFGNFTAEPLILDKEGCKILKSMELKPNICGKNSDLEGCCLKDIKILSRLGQVFVLEKKIDGKAYNFSIPKDHILSWRILKKKAKGESGNDKASASAKTDTKKKTETCSKDEQAEAS